jgi:CubicO group peptidase (beta-lactamase class C family)
MLPYYRAILLLITATSLLLGACSYLPPRQNTNAGMSKVLPTQPENSQETRTNSSATISVPTPAFVEVSNDPLAAELDQYIRLRHPLFSGVVLVAHNGRILLNRGYKYSNWEQETPNTPATKYRLASLTKPITGLAVMMLQERGMLDTKDPICNYLPDCPAEWQPITIHHLLTHTSGIPDYTAFEAAFEDARDPHSVADLVDSFKGLPLEFAPGEKFQYSNSGYILLGVIIELVSKLTYQEFIFENIIYPLGLESTGLDYNKRVLKERASGYSIEGKTFINAPFLDMSNAYAAGGLFSSDEDLYRLGRVLFSDQLISAKTREAMFTPYVFADNLGSDYGYGWQVGEHHGHRWVGHEGGLFGFHNFMIFYPDDKAAIIVLCNIDTLDVVAIADGLEEIILPTSP